LCIIVQDNKYRFISLGVICLGVVEEDKDEYIKRQLDTALYNMYYALLMMKAEDKEQFGDELEEIFERTARLYWEYNQDDLSIN